VCEEDPYFRELLRYIHLSPLHAGAIESQSELDKRLKHQFPLAERIEKDRPEGRQDLADGFAMLNVELQKVSRGEDCGASA
jgi:hypothetical protein